MNVKELELNLENFIAKAKHPDEQYAIWFTVSGAKRMFKELKHLLERSDNIGYEVPPTASPKLPSIDLLFIELSQFTSAKTEKERQLESLLMQVLTAWKEDCDMGDGIQEKDRHLFNRAMKKVNKSYEPI